LFRANELSRAMNYRHAFHAGNFADVIKHVVLTRVLLYLHGKPAAFRVIDTHAGAGLYDLAGDEAIRGGEWRDGIGRVLGAETAGKAAVLLRPYLDIVRAFNGTDKLTAYPGSPLIARALLRPQDRLVACELEPLARRQLLNRLRRDRQARVVDLDGWMALTAYLPPQERRGVVLIDPPFERPDEFDRLARGFAAAFAKWPDGIYLLWYPVKDSAAARKLARSVGTTVADRWPGASAAAREHCLRLEFGIGRKDAAGGLRAAGLLIVNPPWVLADELRTVLSVLARLLGRDGPGHFSLDSPVG
jgi:23S rRNA (adenine2030-N6)-methyltransferase